MALDRWLTDEERARAAANGICEKTLYYRLYRSDKWELEEALTAPPGTVRHNYEGKNHKWLKLARENGINTNTFNDRLRRNWGHYKAATKPVKRRRCWKMQNKEKPRLKDYAKAAEIGVSKKYVDQRMEELGWSLERAITTPVGTSWEGNERNTKLLKLAEKNGISESTFYRRKRNGMTPYDAATRPKGFEEYIPLAESNGINNKTFYQRVKRKMDPYEAATKPPRKYKKKQIS